GFGYREEQGSAAGVRSGSADPMPDTRHPAPDTRNPTRASDSPVALASNPEPRTPIPLTIFEAPNRYVEAEMVARAFRRLHESEGYAWSDFAVILRAMGDYAPILSAVFERYEIPFGVDGPEQLSENPLIKTVLHLLTVVRDGWQREDLLAFLKS